ncbi:MAG: hypothetical protein QOJ85_4718 [Solirubrobacteraceae bacterium]|nr:hypothetical protein [Solirubrobacteraceae bacterium]
MRRTTSSFRREKRWLAPALLTVALVPATPAAAAKWRLEPISASEGVAGLHDLSFDSQGHALLSWAGALQGREPPIFGGLASRDPGGGWQRPPDLADVEPQTARIHLYGESRALLVARQARTTTSKRSLVIAEGGSDGGFGPLQVLDDFTVDSWSAANELGQALIAWTNERSPFIRVSERLPGQDPSPPPRDLAIATSAAVAINARGDRVLAFPESARRLGARVRRAGGEWGPIVAFGHLASTKGIGLSAVVARNGRVVVTWGAVGRECGVSVGDVDGTWRTRRLERRCGPAAVGPHAAPVVPVADSGGATYVAWTGHARTGRRAVKFARVGPGASRRALVLSRQPAALLDAVAAGPGHALAVTWTAPQPEKGKPFIVATFAAVRRAGGGFDADRLTPPTAVVARGSRVAFQPLTGEPVVAVPFLVGRTVAVGAAVGPPAPLGTQGSARAARRAAVR